MNKAFVEREEEPPEIFASANAFSSRLRQLVDEARESGAGTEKELKRSLTPFLRDMGQIPEKRVRQEFMKVTAKIGCPEITRAHSLRHLFSTRAQEQGLNPFVVQGILGHSTLDMTGKYTHFRMDAKREAVSELLQRDPVLRDVVTGLDRGP